MGKTFDERMREQRRALILRLLSEQPTYQMNSSNLYMNLDFMRIPISRAVLQDDLNFLANNGLVRVDPLVEGIFSVELTATGMEVVRGVQTIPGVSRPDPK